MDFPDLSEFSEEPIQFHFEEVAFDLPDSEKLIDWIQATIKAEQKELQFINFIFCNDQYLQEMNVTYLNHDTLTDVITFPYSTDKSNIEGDIYISLERIAENAVQFKVSTLQELKRVMIHGILHLCGYGDKSEAEKKTMTEKEDFYLKKI